MKEIKEYVFATVNTDVGVGGVKTLAEGGIDYGRPESSNLDWSKTRLTFTVPRNPPSEERLPQRDGFRRSIVHFEVWGQDIDANDAIIHRLEELFLDRPWDVPGRRVDQVLYVDDNETYFTDIEVHHDELMLAVYSIAIS